MDKIVYTLFGLLLFVNIGSTQKLKKDIATFPYISAPSDSTQVPHDFVWRVNETKIDNLGKEINKIYKSSTLASTDPNIQFYKSNLDRLPGFTRKTYHHISGIAEENQRGIAPACFVDVKVSPTNVIRKVINKKQDLKDGVKTIGTALSYDITIIINRSFVFYKNMTEELYRNNDMSGETKMTFNFPRDFKAPSGVRVKGYLTKGQLDNEYLKNQHAFLTQIRKQFIHKWLSKNYSRLASRYSERRTSFSTVIYYVKNKKGGYEDLEIALEKMRQIESLVKGNKKLGNKKNWHTEEIQKLAKECEMIWFEALEEERKAKESGTKGRLDYAMTMGITKNWIWSRFLQNDFDFCINQCFKLHPPSKDAEISKEVRKLYLPEMRKMMEDYKKRFLVNADKYHWIVE